jgi:hypothetical protein
MALLEPFTFSSYPSTQHNESAAEYLAELSNFEQHRESQQQQQHSQQGNKSHQNFSYLASNSNNRLLIPTLKKENLATPNRTVIGLEQQVGPKDHTHAISHLPTIQLPPLSSIYNELATSTVSPRFGEILSSSSTNSLQLSTTTPPLTLTDIDLNKFPQLSSVIDEPPSEHDTTGHTNIQPTIMYRNLFHSVECQLPLNEDGVCQWDGVRVFIDEHVGYSGNAKLFKQRPDSGERALLLSCKVLDPNRRELSQCDSCREYFDNRLYFKSNPHIKGRILLIKNNNVIVVENGAYWITLKYMCCCKHHGVSSYILYLTLTDNITGNIVASALYPTYVKQWRKSTQKKQSCTIFFS